MIKDPRKFLFYKSVFNLSLPIIIQNLVMVALNLLDGVMIGRLGGTAIAAVGLANQVFFLYSFLLMGLAGGCSIFISQFYGKKDIKNIKKVLGVALLSALLAGITIFIISLLFSENILRIYSPDKEVIEKGASYLRITAFSYIMLAITNCYSSALRSVKNTALPMKVSIFAIAVNIVLNYLLIYGKYGFPELNIEGAAIATVIARTIECVLIIILVYYKKTEVAAKLSELISFNFRFLKKILRTSMPLVVNDLFWAIGMSLFNVIYARINTESLVAVTVCNNLESLFLVIFVGLTNTAAIMIGNKIGGNNQLKAYSYGKKFLFLGFAFSLILGIVIFYIGEPILSIYKLSTEEYSYALKILWVTAIVLWIKALNMILIGGIIKSGGDSKFTLYLGFSTTWLIGLPLAYLGGFVFKLDIYIIVLIVMIEELVKLIIAITRFCSKKWIRNLITDV